MVMVGILIGKVKEMGKLLMFMVSAENIRLTEASIDMIRDKDIVIPPSILPNLIAILGGLIGCAIYIYYYECKYVKDTRWEVIMVANNAKLRAANTDTPLDEAEKLEWEDKKRAEVYYMVTGTRTIGPSGADYTTMVDRRLFHEKIMRFFGARKIEVIQLSKDKKKPGYITGAAQLAEQLLKNPNNIYEVPSDMSTTILMLTRFRIQYTIKRPAIFIRELDLAVSKEPEPDSTQKEDDEKERRIQEEVEEEEDSREEYIRKYARQIDEEYGIVRNDHKGPFRPKHIPGSKSNYRPRTTIRRTIIPKHRAK